MGKVAAPCTKKTYSTDSFAKDAEELHKLKCDMEKMKAFNKCLGEETKKLPEADKKELMGSFKEMEACLTKKA